MESTQFLKWPLGPHQLNRFGALAWLVLHQTSITPIQTMEERKSHQSYLNYTKLTLRLTLADPSRLLS